MCWCLFHFCSLFYFGLFYFFLLIIIMVLVFVNVEFVLLWAYTLGGYSANNELGARLSTHSSSYNLGVSFFLCVVKVCCVCVVVFVCFECFLCVFCVRAFLRGLQYVSVVCSCLFCVL